MTRFTGKLIVRAFTADEMLARPGAKQLYQLQEPLVFHSSFGPVEARQGLVTDFCSRPWFTAMAIDKDDPRVLYASVIHDQIYAMSGNLRGYATPLTRQQADWVLREAIVDCGGSDFFAQAVYVAVREGGKGHWVEHPG